MNYLSLLRPKQWVKQGFVFIPLLSLGSDLSLKDLLLGICSMAVFTGIASIVYLYNDYSDLEYDKKDPIRSKRSLASGTVTPTRVLLLAAILLFASTLTCMLLSRSVLPSFVIIFIYFLTNFLYSTFHLKTQNILGISLVAMGFPIRFAFGCTFLGLPISYWAISMIMLLALFMLSIKRYQLTIRTQTPELVASHEFWLISATTFAAFFAASYAGFVSSPLTQKVWGSSTLLISSIPVALGVVRFIELGTDKKKINTEDVTDIVAHDIPIILLIVAYGLIMLLGRISVN